MGGVSLSAFLIASRGLLWTQGPPPTSPPRVSWPAVVSGEARPSRRTLPLRRGPIAFAHLAGTRQLAPVPVPASRCQRRDGAGTPRRPPERRNDRRSAASNAATTAGAPRRPPERRDDHRIAATNAATTGGETTGIGEQPGAQDAPRAEDERPPLYHLY